MGGSYEPFMLTVPPFFLFVFIFILAEEYTTARIFLY